MSLRGRRDFERVLAQGGRARSGPLALAVTDGTDPAGRLRLGIAVRAPGRAVVRNRIRRRLKEAFRRAGLSGRDVVVRAGEDALRVGFQELVASVQVGMERAEGRR